jgi:hypothetical protein
MYKFLLAVAVVVLIVWLVSREGYCGDCSDRKYIDTPVFANPFIWPYSATSCPDDLYTLQVDKGLDLGLRGRTCETTSLRAPDHRLLTG